MKHRLMITLAACFAVLMSVNAMANSFGVDITIPDNHTGTGLWYGNHEDQEVEPGMVATQQWDLEGFFLEGTKLSIVSGYDLKNGAGEFKSGDIFIDVDGDAVYGDIHRGSNGYHQIQNTFGYDYVLVLDFNTSMFTAYAIGSDAQVLTAWYLQNQGSSPWRYVSGGALLFTQSLSYRTGLTDIDTGFSGGRHNALTVDLSSLNVGAIHGTEFTSHFTMGCGNDNLMGHGQLPSPEPASLVLLGCGLIGFAGFIRKKHGRASGC